MNEPYDRTRVEGDPTGASEQTATSTMYGTRCDYVNRNNPSAWYGISSTRVYPTGYEGKSTVDVVTPGFTRIVRSGGIVNNNYSMTYDKEIRASPATLVREYTYKSGSAYWGTKWNGPLPMTDAELGSYLLRPDVDGGTVSAQIQSLIDQAVTQAHANASSSEMQALVAAAEAQKTVQSIESIMRRAFKVLRKARKLDFASLSKELSPSELKDRYMELRYALRPLMYDADNTMKALATSGALHNTRRVARGYANGTWSKQDTIYTYPTSDIIRTINREISIAVDIRAGVLCDVNLSLPSVWGIDQVATSAWELVPFSFVADWFVDVGNKLAAFSPNAGVRKLASWVTVTETTSHVNSYVSSACTLGSWTTNTETWGGTKQHITVHKYRQVNPSLDLLPNVTVRLNTFKILDLAAMISNLFR